MTTKSDIVRKLSQCGAAIEKAGKLRDQLVAMILEVYSVDYSEEDCDPIIDVADLNGGPWVGGVAALDRAIHEYSGVLRPTDNTHPAPEKKDGGSDE